MTTVFIVLALFSLTGQPVTAAVYTQKSYATKSECQVEQPQVVAELNARLALKGLVVKASDCMTQAEIDEITKQVQ